MLVAVAVAVLAVGTGALAAALRRLVREGAPEHAAAPLSRAVADLGAGSAALRRSLPEPPGAARPPL